MYYLKIRDTEEAGNTLIYYCRNCGHEDTTLSSESVCVSETQLRRSEQKYTHMVNEYTKFDPTLPRINTIKCPNQECSSNTIQVGGGKKGATATGATEKKPLKMKGKLLKKPTTEKEKLLAEEAQEQEQEQEQQQEQQHAITTGENEREVIYIRYDDINMKYVYLCVHCDTTWKTDNRA
jgi:DNA-directed RNA polymerase subunit M/transcription elongation factor TFIIS